MRQGLAGTAASAAVLTSSQGVSFQWRSSSGASLQSALVQSAGVPVRVKLSRSGGSVSAFYSMDGLLWTQIGAAQSIILGNSLLPLTHSVSRR